MSQESGRWLSQLKKHVRSNQEYSYSSVDRILVHRTVTLKVKRFTHYIITGTHHLERATTPYYYHGVFTGQSIFSLNFPRIETPAEPQ